MIEISANQVKKSFGFGNIFNDISFVIKTGERVSLVGNNGCGKSTLLKLINKEYSFDAGNISIQSKAKIGYLSQIIDKEEDDIIVKDILYRSFKDILDIENKLYKYELEMQKYEGKKLNKLVVKYCNLQEKFQSLGGYEIQEKINKIIEEFKLANIINHYFNKLSGGEKRIVKLASIMVDNPTLLLLDEPTNHLDIETLEWLEDYLNRYNGTILVVSHDRYFLDKITNKTILLENGNVIIFHGNYSYYLNKNEDRLLIEYEKYKNQQKKINNMKKQIKQLRQWGQISDNEIFYKRAFNIEKRLERMDLINRPSPNKKIPIDFVIDKITGKEVLVLNDYSLNVENKNLIINSDLNIYQGDRICLIGKNGCGKSSLIKDILNKFDGESSSIKFGSNLNIGYIPQEINFDSAKRVIDIAKMCFFDDESHLRSALAKFLFFSDSVFKRASNLSGGEKIRLKLFELMQKNSNFIILDEPTNHIDIETKEVLENALREYKGTLLFISHDRFFINEVATKIVLIENQKLYLYNGNYDYYINVV